MAKPPKPKMMKFSVDRVVKSGLLSRPCAPNPREGLGGRVLFFPEWCKRCGLCTVICPTQALQQRDDGSPYFQDETKCKLCSLCWRICPEFAITKNPDIKEEL